MTGSSDGASALPVPMLRPFVRRYEGYRLHGYEPGSHIGMPSVDLTVILPFDAPMTIGVAAEPQQQPGEFGALASGLGSRPVVIEHDGNQHGIQLSLTPAGCRAIFGVPASALKQWIVALDDLLGSDAASLMDGAREATGWPERFAVLDRVLSNRVRGGGAIDAPMHAAWSVLTGADAVRVGAVASSLGWSDRHLQSRFGAEFGISPGTAVRLARFGRSHRLLRQPRPPLLAEVAAACGYYDQAHMARDWRALAGAAPSVWRADEKFAFVQDGGVVAGTGSTP